MPSLGLFCCNELMVVSAEEVKVMKYLVEPNEMEFIITDDRAHCRGPCPHRCQCNVQWGEPEKMWDPAPKNQL